MNNYKKLLKITRNKKKKRKRIVILARSKLNGIENKISEALPWKISHEKFVIIINEEKSYCELKEINKVMKSHRNDSEK